MFGKFLNSFIRVISVLFLVGMIMLSILGLFPQGFKVGLMVLAGLTLLVFLFILAVNKLSIPKYMCFWLCFIAIGLVIRFAYAFTVDIEVVSDQLKCLNAAKQVAQGNFSWATADPYFERWAYQIPFVLYEGLIYKLFGTVRALYVFNGFFSAVTCFLIYAIVKKIYNYRVALITTALFSCFPLFIFSIGRLYNQIVAGVFLLLAIYFFISVCQRSFIADSKRNFLKTLLLCALSGALLGISNLFRTEAIIGMIAFECWFVYNLIISIKKEKISVLIFRSLLCMFITYALYKAVNVSVDLSISYLGISPHGIKNGCIYWFIVCGLTPESFGAYSTKYSYITEYKDPNQQFEVFKNILKEIINGKSIGNILSFFARKEYIMWGQISYCTTFNANSHIPNIVYTVFNNVNHCGYILILLLTSLGVKKKQFNSIIAFFSILFLGFFFAFVIKEISPVYRYSTLLILFLMSASGIDFLLKNKTPINSIISRIKRVKQ